MLDENEKTVYLPEKDMALDLGAIAKGYIADRIKDLILEDANFCSQAMDIHYLEKHLLQKLEGHVKEGS